MKLPKWPDPNNRGIHLGLNRILILLEKLGNPQKKMKNVIHIAGTNGKGSTTAFLKAILEENGYTVNRYTSPHLLEFNERIEIKGKKITDEYYEELAERVKKVVDEDNLNISYFEAITVIAFIAFAESNADVNIIEVGLGGALDATNLFDNPLIDVITTISFDHMSLLGDTLPKIACEKWGIVKKGASIVLGGLNDEIKDLYKKKNKDFNNQMYFFNEDYEVDIIDDKSFSFQYKDIKMILPTPTLEGKHQIMNASIAIMSFLIFKNFLNIDVKTIEKALIKCEWPARLQNLKNTKLGKLLPENYELWLDGAHNEDGATVLSNWINEKQTIDNKETVAIISILKKKDSIAYIDNLKKSIDLAITIRDHQPDFDFKKADVLKEELEEKGIKVINIVDNVVDALKYLNDIDEGKSKRIVICGSLYFAAEVLELI